MIHWERVNEPIVELERYGLTLRVVNFLENGLGAIYIRDLQPLKDEDILTVGHVAEKELKVLKESLKNFMTAETID